MSNVVQRTTVLIVLTAMLLVVMWASPAYAQKGVAPAPVEVAPAPDSDAVDLGAINVRVDGEHLVFASGEDVDAFLNLVINQDETFLDSVESALGYQSLRAAEEVALDAGEQSGDFTVADPYFATVLGADAKVQIDNIVSLVTDDYVYSVDVAQADLLDQVSAEKSKVSKEVEIQSREDDALEKRSAPCISFNKKHRLCGSTNRTYINLGNFFSYSSVRGRTYAQERKCILFVCWWRSEDISQIGLEGTFDLEVCITGMCDPVPGSSTSDSDTNESSVSRTYHWDFTVNAPPVCHQGGASAHHTGTRNGVSRTLDTSGYWSC